jgi:hypothetical protein
MRRSILASSAGALALAAVAGLPAYAQSSSSGSTASPQGASKAQPHAMSQDKLRQTLSQAGFKDIVIMDAAYLVQAKTQDNNTVMMLVNPPSAATTGSVSSSGGSNPSSTPGSAPAKSGGQAQ